jgi:membrane protein
LPPSCFGPAAWTLASALCHGAAIAYYTIFSIAPVLVIVIAIAGLFFGHDAAEGAIVDQLRGLMGEQAAEAMQTAVKSASSHRAGVVATVVGVGTLVLTASGVFSEMQSSLNIIWKAAPRTSAVTRLVKARLLSLGLTWRSASCFSFPSSLVPGSKRWAHGWAASCQVGAFLPRN